MPITRLLLLLLGGTAACVRGVPAPDFAMPFDSVPPAAILAYLNKLEFADRMGVGDEQPLIVACPSACRLGPQVAIQPERRSFENSEKSLGRPGRIIARMINRDKEAYPRYNLAPEDTVYWAVDQVRPVSNRLSQGRSLFISIKGLREQRATAVVVRNDLQVDEHPGEYWPESLARWIPDTTAADKGTPGGGVDLGRQFYSLMAWGNCKPGSCCKN